MIMLAMSTLDPVVQGIFFLIAVVLFVIAAWLARPALWAVLVAAGLAFYTFVWMYNAFAAA
jgi:hypothetical protein